MIRLSEILANCWPDRPWRVVESDPPQIIALDGGAVPTLAEVETRRSEAETIIANIIASRQASPQEMLAAARSQMAVILDSLPLADRRITQKIRVDVEHALNLGQVDLAKYIVETEEIPEHLESTRSQILALFP